MKKNVTSTFVRASRVWVGELPSASSSRRFKSMMAALIDIIRIFPFTQADL
jgi:hypothetical protein